MKRIIALTMLLLFTMSTVVFAGGAKKRNGYKHPNWTPPEGYNQTLKKGGYGIKVHKFKEKRSNGTWITRYKYTIIMPCFYTAPKNTPCDRGTFSRDGTIGEKDKPASWSINRVK